MASSAGPNIVKSLDVIEVSLVDEPANPGARVTLFKRRDPRGHTEDSDMPTMDELAKGLTEAETKIDALTKSVESKDAEIGALKADLEKAKAGKPAAPAEEDIFKGMSPAAIELVKKMQADSKAQAEELAKMRDRDETGEAIAKARAEYPSAPATTPAEIGPIMKRVASNKATAEDVTKLHQVLKASSALVEKALDVAEHGSVVIKNGDGSVISQVDAKAQELMKSDSKLTLDDARYEVFKRSPDLAAAYRDEMNRPKSN